MKNPLYLFFGVRWLKSNDKNICERCQEELEEEIHSESVFIKDFKKMYITEEQARSISKQPCFVPSYAYGQHNMQVIEFGEIGYLGETRFFIRKKGENKS